MFGQTKNENSGFLFWMVLLVAYSYCLYYLSSGPIKIHLPYFAFRDKVAHAGVYGLMALLAWQAFSRWTVTSHWFWAWLYAVVYGATDEWHQFYVPGRHADVWDWVADIAGATITLLLVKIWITFRQNQAWDEDTRPLL